ncbi:MAG: hypothetical protein AAFP90_01420 [Planctomycetota bacterium]
MKPNNIVQRALIAALAAAGIVAVTSGTASAKDGPFLSFLDMVAAKIEQVTGLDDYQKKGCSGCDQGCDGRNVCDAPPSDLMMPMHPTTSGTHHHHSSPRMIAPWADAAIEKAKQATPAIRLPAASKMPALPGPVTTSGPVTTPGPMPLPGPMTLPGQPVSPTPALNTAPGIMPEVKRPTDPFLDDPQLPEPLGLTPINRATASENRVAPAGYWDR